MATTFRLERSADTRTLTLSRAQCLDTAGHKELRRALTELARDDGMRALILASDHPAALLIDVAELVALAPAEARAFSQAGHQLADALATVPSPGALHVA